MIKAIIKFDFLQLFLYKGDIGEDGLVYADRNNITEWKKGEEVEVLKEFQSSEFHGGTAYVIYNPKNHKSITVGYHVIEFIR